MAPTTAGRGSRTRKRCGARKRNPRVKATSSRAPCGTRLPKLHKTAAPQVGDILKDTSVAGDKPLSREERHGGSSTAGAGTARWKRRYWWLAAQPPLAPLSQHLPQSPPHLSHRSRSGTGNNAFPMPLGAFLADLGAVLQLVLFGRGNEREFGVVWCREQPGPAHRALTDRLTASPSLAPSEHVPLRHSNKKIPVCKNEIHPTELALSHKPSEKRRSKLNTQHQHLEQATTHHRSSALPSQAPHKAGDRFRTHK